MDTALMPVVISLGIALAGILALAVIVGRRRRFRDQQRMFTREQKQQLMARAHGRCEHKAPLWLRCPAAGEQADHIVPWSRAGPTQLWNGQLLCAGHNKRKSNRMPTSLYRWRLMRRRRKY